MKDEQTSRKGSILTSVLAGGALGVGLALLLAPKSGTETRKDLKRVANRFSQAIDIGKDLYDESREFASKAMEAGKKAYVEEKPLEPIINEKRSLMMPILASGIIGAGIGAGIALLLAPKSGAETRKDLRRFASSTGEQVVSAIDKGKDMYKAGKDAITAAVESGNIEYVEGKKKFEHAV
ncbi:MAG: YtxH domain-containing protein [Methanothrix sp.]|nr:YtxH domain-containing protein [Methanothrix sp.]